MEFQVGDQIIMKRNAPYGFTQGVITEVYDTLVEVMFDYLSREGYTGTNPTFTVGKNHCKHTKPISQQERVCNKIKLMESRWEKFQERKHSYV